MLKDESFALKCLLHINAEYFENKYLAWAFNKIRFHNDKYGTPPTVRYLWDQLKMISADEQESYKASLNKIASSDLQRDESYLRDDLTRFIQTNEFKKMHRTEGELFNSGQFAEAYAYVSDQITKIQQISFADKSFIQAKDIDIILKKVQDSYYEYVPLGIPQIDKALNGGFPKKSVTTIMGAWNVGKSIFGINAAYFAAKSGKNVLYVFHEGRKEQIVVRFLSRISGLPYNGIMAGDYLESQESNQKMEDAKEFLLKHIRIREMREVGVSVEDVYAYCKATMREWPFDALYDDYGQKLITGKKNFRELRHVHGHIWNTFDLMSAELDIAIVTFAQFNRETVKFNRTGSKITRSEGVSECAQIAHVSETILTINKSPKDEEEQKLIVCLDKCRDSRAGLLVGCKTNFRNMRAYDPSLGFKNEGYDIPTEDKDDKND